MKEESEKVGLKLNIQKTKIMAFGPMTPWQIDGKQWKQWLNLLYWAPKSSEMVTAAMKLKDTPWKESYDQPRQLIKKQRQWESRWRRNRTGRSLSLLQIHRKNNRTSTKQLLIASSRH